MHGQAERVAKLERVGTGKRAGKVQARKLLQEAASEGRKFVGSESLSMFKQRHGCSSSRSSSRSRSQSPLWPEVQVSAAEAAAEAATAARLAGSAGLCNCSLCSRSRSCSRSCNRSTPGRKCRSLQLQPLQPHNDGMWQVAGGKWQMDQTSSVQPI